MTVVQANVEIITPELAEKLLESNTNNRNLKRDRIAQYAADMQAGKWDLNGEAIKIASTGRLLDGQNRLHGCVKAGVPFQSVVIRGLGDDTQVTMDGGAARSLADALRLKGETSTNNLSAVINGAYVFAKGARRSFNQSPERPTKQQALAFLAENPGLRDVSRLAQQLCSALGVSNLVTGAIGWKLPQIDAADFEYFINKLKEPYGEAGDPIFELRLALLSGREQKMRGGRGMNPSYQLAIICKAWNKFRSGEQVGILRYRQGGAKPEAFPEPF
jgi:hypothetical protein